MTSKTQTAAQGNARQLARLLETGEGYADIYRSDYSGYACNKAVNLRNTLVGRLQITEWACYELRVIDPKDGSTVVYGSLTWKGYHDGIGAATAAVTGI